MSSRALRKAQREKEEQERLEKLQGDENDADDGEEHARPAARPSAFAMLGEENEDDDIEEDDDHEDGENDVPVDADHSTTELSHLSSRPNGKKKKKNKRKKSKKAGGVHPVDDAPHDEDLDEIDRALKQLSTSNNAVQRGETAAGADSVVDEINRLLRIDTNHLHAENEMRRLFGRAALEHADGDDDNANLANANVGGNRRQQRRGQQLGLAQALRGQHGTDGRSNGLAAIALKRNLFVQGKSEWPVATGGGLGMEVEEKRADGTILFKFVHNRTYQNVQGQFDSCVESMDPNRLVILLQHNPYHISTLLQVSEIAKQERDHATSGDLLERALFSFGRASHSTFAKTLADGKARLDFARPENREFWLASWRYMQNLSMRGTWRTVYEWAKTLLSLSPDRDPYALWLVLDQYALRARQDLDFLNISRNAFFKEQHHDMPNIQLSQALAERRAGSKSKGQQALFTAVGRFPWVIARLMQELTIDAPPAVWGKQARTDRENLYAELYATRAKDVWNTPEMIAFLTEVASAVQPETASSPPDVEEISRDEARHVLLSDVPALIALIPRKYTAALTSTSDPLPPSNDNPSYAASPSAGQRAQPRTGTPAENLRELQGLYGFFSRLFPWFSAETGGMVVRDTNDDDDNDDEAANDENRTNNGGALGRAPVRPSEAEIERLIQDSGIGEDVIMARTQRLMELQNQLMGQLGEDEAGVDSRVIALPPENESGAGHGIDEVDAEGVPRRARVEDGSEEDD